MPAVTTTIPGLDPEAATPAFLDRIPRDFARRWLVLSQGMVNDDVQRLAIAPTTPADVLHNVARRLEADVETLEADPAALAAAIDAAFGTMGDDEATESDADDLGGDIDALLAASDRDLLTTEGKGPVVKLVDAVLFDALRRSASDVHLQPIEDRTLIRYRLDGVLHTVRELPAAATAAVVSRIKVMGRMDIAERRIPQDGRATVTIGSSDNGGRAVDLRISTLPTAYGERAVLRLLDNTQQLCDFEQLGMPTDVARPFLERASRSNGVILVTGPTGSGKTTTLYAALREIGSAAVNIMTIEDPIEYELSTADLAISQAQVNTRKGVTFASGLRHILRQDPDVIMVGEIRDAETARIAIQASLTGHLVFSTLHTNDAPSVATRMVDLGVEPYLVASSLSAVLAQRLVRRVHSDCAGAGCDACLGTGYRGRIGIFELMTITDAIRDMIPKRVSVNALREAGREAGLHTLREAGEQLVAQGRTSVDELRRVTGGVS